MDNQVHDFPGLQSSGRENEEGEFGCAFVHKEDNPFPLN